MKVAQCVSWYFPDSSGGCEVYVEGLTRCLDRIGVESVVLAPAVKDIPPYLHNGVPVIRYPIPANPTPRELGETAPARGLERFVELLKEQRADIYHQHSWRYGCGRFHLRRAKAAGLPTVLTAHMPEACCPRRTMMRNGDEECDGRLSIDACAPCLTGIRPDPWVQHLCALVPIPSRVSGLMQQRGPAALRRIGSGAEICTRIHRFQEHYLEMARNADKVVAVSRWLANAFYTNGVARDKVVVSQHGVYDVIHPAMPSVPGEKPGNGPLRLGFLGRWDAIKGAQIVIRAIRCLPASLPVHLTIHAMEANEADRTNRQEVLAELEGENRVRIMPPLERREVAAALGRFDMLVVPSQWLETGPLVVLEALATGVPVMGSSLGGIREYVEHGRNGWLVRHDDVTAWAEAIRMFAMDRDRLEVLRQGIRLVRRMEDVAAEMANLYRLLVPRVAVHST